ncbi:MAG: tryptophan-rich sensory protein [Clostridia bacterium]|nr:tryptophan-rich sensory protein [Clostridia bacterium]MBO5316139.1 tryptophan-rich sensory protein [Clostridia bacterium]
MWEKIKPYIRIYIIAIAIPIGVGLLSTLFTKDNMNIYEELIVPNIAPPALVFPIVWTVLYTLMGVSSAMVYNRRITDTADVRSALTTYAVSLVINFGWSIIFFNANAFLLSFLWLILLLYFVIKTILEYKKIEPLAAYLQIPYALWVTFAGYLNIAIYFLNT